MEISVSDFRQQCLALLDKLPAEGIIITRHGKAIARVMPLEPASCVDLIGSAPDLIVDPDDDLLSTGIRWDAES